MRISRREFMKYCTIAAGALGLTTTDLLKIDEALGKTGDPTAPHVVWLPGQSCTGCTMSLTNSIFYTDVGSLVLNDINLDYSETLAAASGEKIVDSAISTIGKPMVLVLEGAIPHGSGEDHFCTVWSRSSGIVAAGSTVNGTAVTNGTLTRKLASATLQQDDVVKAGSEIVNPTQIPAGSTVASAADRTALGGTYVATGLAGNDILNTNITFTAPIGPLSGPIDIWGGTSLPVNTIGTTSILAAGTIVESSFDRIWLSNLDPSQPAAATPAATWTNDANGNPWVLVGNITLLVPRSVAGPFQVAATSTLDVGTVLKAGTRVSALADRLAIDPTLVAFGYGSTESNVLASTLTYTGADYVLTGDITLPVSPAVAAGSLGFTTTEADKTMLNESVLFATSAAAVLCVGTCSSFGGIPAAKGNRTGAAGALYTGLSKPGSYNGAMSQFAAKTVNIPGCPPHSDWIVGTIAFLLKTNFQIPDLEAYARPMSYFGEYQCNAGPCEWRYNYGYVPTEEVNYFNPKADGTNVSGLTGGALPAAHATINSSKLYKYKWANSTAGQRFLGCIGVLGCKGRKTKADCSLRRWNGNNSLASGLPFYGANWCVGSGAGCHGCTEPTFPDVVGKFFNFR
jgi:Ni,Fe-hydrogenase I small subunit